MLSRVHTHEDRSLPIGARIATLIDCAGMARRMAGVYATEGHSKDAERKLTDARWYLRLARERIEARSE